MVMSSLTDDTCYRTVLFAIARHDGGEQPGLHPGSNQLPGHARSQE
jgi:hypothetical protein